METFDKVHIVTLQSVGRANTTVKKKRRSDGDGRVRMTEISWAFLNLMLTLAGSTRCRAVFLDLSVRVGVSAGRESLEGHDVKNCLVVDDLSKQ